MRTFFIVKFVDELFLKKKFLPVGKKSYQLEKNPSRWKKSPRLNKFLTVGKKILPVGKKFLPVGKKSYLVGKNSVEDEMNIFVSKGYFSEIR